MKQKETRKVISTDSIMVNWELAKEAKLHEKSEVYYQDQVFENDALLEEELEKLSFDPIPVNNVFQKEEA